jgi:hypothetical protein
LPVESSDEEKWAAAETFNKIVELKKAVQIGIVVANLEETTRLLSNLFGIGAIPVY